MRYALVIVTYFIVGLILAGMVWKQQREDELKYQDLVAIFFLWLPLIASGAIMALTEARREKKEKKTLTRRLDPFDE